MSDAPTLAPPLAEVRRLSGSADKWPYSHITFTLVAWNEEPRLAELLLYVQPFFENIVVGVQRSTDRTLEIARQYANVVVEDEHRGYGDATYGPGVLRAVKTRWSLKLDADEWPERALLSSLSSATWWAEHVGTQGIWIPFRSWVEGIEYTEQHAHLRLFQTHVGWPDTLHSRPPIEDGILWPEGHIQHERSLDELERDYLRYFEIGRGNGQWEAHNRLMMRSAAEGTAERRGWDYVKSFDWWPQVEAIAFKEE